MLKLFKYLGACLMLLAAAMVAHAEEVETDTFTAKYNVDGYRLMGVKMQEGNVSIKIKHDDMGEILLVVSDQKSKIPQDKQMEFAKAVREQAMKDFGIDLVEPHWDDQSYSMGGNDAKGNGAAVFVTFNKAGDRVSILYGFSTFEMLDVLPGYFNYHFTAKDPSLFPLFM